jgi:adenylate cyclase
LEQLMAYTHVSDSLQAITDRSAMAAYESTVIERQSAVEIERQRASIRQQRIVLFSIGGGLVLLTALAFAVYRGKKRSDELLLNILPAEVANELKAKGHADAKHFENVTILFTDFKGFTEASEKLSPQELVEELNTCFKAFDQIITARGIEKIKTIGDAYMCAGGLPVPSSSTPAGVVLAALEMQAFMVTRKKERDALGKPAFEMRAGIHTGPVVAGIVGVKKFQYDIWGDTVNTASRMESSGEVGQVNISEATYALVKDVVADDVASNHRVDPNGGVIDRRAFTLTPRGKVQAKGKGQMEMYFVRQVLQEPEMERIDPPSP